MQNKRNICVKAVIYRRHSRTFNLEVLWIYERERGSAEKGFVKPAGWGLPGGNAEPEETPEKAICREIEEETGLVVGEPEKSFSIICRPDHDIYLYVIAEEDIIGGKLRLAGKEHSKAQWVPLEQPPENAYKSSLRFLSIAKEFIKKSI